MAKPKIHWKSRKRFGLSGGRHAKYRKCKNMSRPKQVPQSYKCNIASGNSIKLRLYRQRIVKSYKRMARNLTKNMAPQYRIQKLSHDETLKFRISKVKRLNKKGYRLINLDCLESHVMEITMHTIMCSKAIGMSQKGLSPISIVSELRTCGLASVLLVKCNGCSKTFKFETSPKLKVNNKVKFDINVRAVWGSIVTGNGAAHLNEMLGTMDSPGISQSSFSNIEEDICSWWENVLRKEFYLAGVEERNIAIEKGEFHQGVPSISVIADGGWCKRSHKHSYNALGGVAIIIGKATGKILHIGIRNRYCFICSNAKNHGILPKPHTCFKNWSESAQAMEADIIVEGFNKAESTHGVRYMKLVGDGDSAVFANIQERVAVWGKDVEKVECANHACKCLRSSLEQLVVDNPNYKGRDKLSKGTRVRLVSAVRCAIRMRSRETDKAKAARLLAHDIRNSIFHIFGNHSNCSDFCKVNNTSIGNIETSNSISNTSTDESDLFPNQGNIFSNLDEEDEGVSAICNDQFQFWTEGTSIDAQEQSRLSSSLSFTDLDGNMKKDVSVLLNRLAVKSSRLIGNFTTNLAESWMHIRSKFDGGKVYNICNRGSWHTRCYGGTLRMNIGPQWSCKVWQEVTGTVPGYHFCKLYAEREKQLDLSTASKKNPQAIASRWKRKMTSLKECNTKKAKLSYGKQAVDVIPDVNTDELEKYKLKFIEKHIEINTIRIQAIERTTREQSYSTAWKDERRKRLTASTFGSIVKRNPKLLVKPLVKRLLYSTFGGNQHTRKGLQEERVTLEEYKLKKAEQKINVQIFGMGLVISPKHKFLAGSPDGKVVEANGSTGLIEVKNLLYNKPINLTTAAKTQPNFCLELSSDRNELFLKQNHDYFYQCQGLMAVTELPWIDFVVRTLNPYQLHIERIFKNDAFFQNQMLPKLTGFYHKALLPEICCPRDGKFPGIREPGLWFEDNQKDSVRKETVLRKRRINVKRKKDNSVSTVTAPSTSLSSSLPLDPGPSKVTPNYSASNPLSTDLTAKSTLSQLRIPDQRTDSTSDKKVANSTSSSAKVSTRRKACSIKKFEGRRISHKWKLDESGHQVQWYEGEVLRVLSGIDGHPGTVHEILYDGEDEPHEVDHLYEDYLESSVKFIDL